MFTKFWAVAFLFIAPVAESGGLDYELGTMDEELQLPNDWLTHESSGSFLSASHSFSFHRILAEEPLTVAPVMSYSYSYVFDFGFDDVNEEQAMGNPSLRGSYKTTSTAVESLEQASFQRAKDGLRNAAGAR